MRLYSEKKRIKTGNFQKRGMVESFSVIREGGVQLEDGVVVRD
jgi:hypothetical protein